MRSSNRETGPVTVLYQDLVPLTDNGGIWYLTKNGGPNNSIVWDQETKQQYYTGTNIQTDNKYEDKIHTTQKLTNF